VGRGVACRRLHVTSVSLHSCMGVRATRAEKTMQMGRDRERIRTEGHGHCDAEVGEVGEVPFAGED
jgi:hypothetical protein